MPLPGPSCPGRKSDFCVHWTQKSLLPLPLFVAGVGADDAHGTVTVDHLAVSADLLYGGSYFHDAVS